MLLGSLPVVYAYAGTLPRSKQFLNVMVWTQRDGPQQNSCISSFLDREEFRKGGILTWQECGEDDGSDESVVTPCTTERCYYKFPPLRRYIRSIQMCHVPVVAVLNNWANRSCELWNFYSWSSRCCLGVHISLPAVLFRGRNSSTSLSWALGSRPHKREWENNSTKKLAIFMLGGPLVAKLRREKCRELAIHNKRAIGVQHCVWSPDRRRKTGERGTLTLRRSDPARYAPKST
jgi:hypothetical protein